MFNTSVLFGYHSSSLSLDFASVRLVGPERLNLGGLIEIFGCTTCSLEKFVSKVLSDYKSIVKPYIKSSFYDDWVVLLPTYNKLFLS